MSRQNPCAARTLKNENDYVHQAPLPPSAVEGGWGTDSSARHGIFWPASSPDGPPFAGNSFALLGGFAGTSREVTLILYVDDMATPRAQVRLADLLRKKGVRPLNVRRRTNERIRLVLVDPTGELSAHGALPEMIVELT
jgi:hypothetical protein